MNQRHADSPNPVREISSLPSISRRRFVRNSLGALVACAIPSCENTPSEQTGYVPRLAARPGSPTIAPTAGASQLGLGEGRDGVLYVPESYSADTPAPLFVALHGAGGRGSDWSSYYFQAEDRGMILLAPDSRSGTWDLIFAGFGPDVAFIDRALRHTFERCNIDPERIALAGFSDGATYALSLGLSNGDLFSHLVAYSPGFMSVVGQPVGEPRIFVSHGNGDTILPVSGSRDGIVPTLRGSGYNVTYEEFEGGHEVDLGVTNLSLNWFL
jgi:phospholipase/carboxylesterase